MDLLAGLGFSLTDGVECPVLTSEEVDRCQSAAEVFEIGKKVRSAFSGPARIDPEFTLGSVLDFTCSPPRRHAFMEVRPILLKVTTGATTLTVRPPAGLVGKELDAWQRNRAEQEYQSKLEAQRAKLEPAYLDERAVKVLKYLAVETPSAEVLYKIYELVEGDPTNRTAVHARLGVSASDFRRFQDSVHNPAVSGDWARHAYHRTPRTKSPMSKSEAESFVRGLAERWLKHIRASAKL